jgi:outer membrane protein assembly factor BamB
MFTFAFGLLLLAGPANVVSPEDVWPQWRGPSADSVAPGRGLPVQWSKTENIQWKTPLPGWGTSTPAVWQDAVFVTTQDNDSLLLLRLDAKTGTIVWQREVGKGTPRRSGELGNLRFHNEHNMASPSPVTDGRHVWVHFGNGDLACYDFAGAPVWSVNQTKLYGFFSIWWGHANSPILFDDLLISACMQDPKAGGKSYVFALDKRTGKERWFKSRDTGAKAEPADSYATPLLYRAKDRTELIVFGGNVLDAYDPASGAPLWQCRVFKGNRVISGPTLAGDTVYAVEGMKGSSFAVRAGGAGDVAATHVRWKHTGPTPDAACPVVDNGLVFLATNSGIVICLDADSGKELWKERLADAFRATPLVAEGKIYFFSKAGAATIIHASREFKVIARAELGEDIMASPAAAHGSLFIRTKEHLYRIGGGK